MDRTHPAAMVFSVLGVPPRAVTLISEYIGYRCTICDAGSPSLTRMHDGNYEFLCIDLRLGHAGEHGMDLYCSTN